jgi:hypothetical protein
MSARSGLFLAAMSSTFQNTVVRNHGSKEVSAVN